MLLYPLVPLVACIVCAVLAGAILARDLGRPANRLAAALLGGAAFWAFCEVLWLAQSDPAVVLRLARLSALGWVWMAPVSLHLFLEISGEARPGLRRAMPGLYGLAGVFLLLDWFTPWIHPAVLRTSWGWSYSLGPAYPCFYLFVTGCVGYGLWIGWQASQRTSSAPAARLQVRGVSLGVLFPLVVASLTDGLLPLAGVHPPRFGTLSFAALGATMLWTFRRHGYLLLAPRTFTAEILETLPDGVAMVGLDGRIQSANGALAQLLGARPGQLLGVRLTDRLSQPVHPTEQVMEQQCELRTLTDDPVPVAISSRLLRDETGRQLGIVVVVRDLQEVVALRDRLLLSGRLAAVGELAAGIAHEINNPLAFVRANLGLLRQHWTSLGEKLEKLADDSEQDLLREGEELVEESLEGVDRAVAIVRDVRGLSHAGDRQRKPCDLNALLQGVLRIAGPQLRGRASVEETLREVPPVWGAPQELQQVFLNLVLNAVQALEGSGTIRVATAPAGRFVLARVEDDGCGIDPKIRDRIFDPFFTTKRVGEGTGLGLGIAYGIVRNHGGDIAVESMPGRGTRFDVHLPVAVDTLEAS